MALSLCVLFAGTLLESFMTLHELEAFSIWLLSVTAFAMWDCLMVHAKAEWKEQTI